METIDAIMGFLDERIDVVAFGLTCKFVATVAYPRHSQFRVIRCIPEDFESLWERFAADVSLAQNVRSLALLHAATPPHIIRDICRVPTVPALKRISHAKPGDRAHISHLVIWAVAKMTNLLSFRWACDPFLVAPDPTGEDSIWRALNESLRLRELLVYDMGHLLESAFDHFFDRESAVCAVQHLTASLLAHPTPS